MMKKPTREEALNLLYQYIENESLRKHAYAVEGVMRYIARLRGEDEEKWSIIGLIHDIDYEKFPDRHCKKTEEILKENGWPSEYIRAAISHGWGICSDVKPETDLEKFLYAIDELTGLVVTTALVRPTKSVFDVEVKSVKNKWKDKRFAAGVDRSIIEKGANMLNIELDELINYTIKGMQEVAELIGLSGLSNEENPLKLTPFKKEGENFQKLHLCDYLNSLSNLSNNVSKINPNQNKAIEDKD